MDHYRRVAILAIVTLATLLVFAPPAFSAPVCTTTYDAATKTTCTTCYEPGVGGDTRECSTPGPTETIDVPVPPSPTTSDGESGPATSPPPPTTTTVPEQPCGGPHSVPRPNHAIEADKARKGSETRAKENLGYEEVPESYGGSRRKQDWGGLSDQIKRLGGFVVTTPPKKKKLVLPQPPKKPPPEGFHTTTDDGEEEKDDCEECDYRILSLITEPLENLPIAAGFPTLEVEEHNAVARATRAGTTQAFAEMRNAVGKLTAAIGIAGGLVTGGVAVAAIELAGYLFSENFANSGDLFKDPDALAGFHTMGISSITIKMPVYYINARYFNMLVCEGGKWKPYKGIHFSTKGPVVETEEWTKEVDSDTVAGVNRRKLEAATKRARQIYKTKVANFAKFKAFLEKVKGLEKSYCPIKLKEWEFDHVKPQGATPKPKKKKDCSDLLKQLQAAEKELAAKTDALKDLQGNLAALQDKLRNAAKKLKIASSTYKAADKAWSQKLGLLNSLKGTRQIYDRDHTAQGEQMRNKYDALIEKYEGELAKLSARRDELKALVDSYKGEIADAKAGIESTKTEINKTKSEIGRLEDKVGELRKAYEECQKEAARRGAFALIMVHFSPPLSRTTAGSRKRRAS